MHERADYAMLETFKESEQLMEQGKRHQTELELQYWGTSGGKVHVMEVVHAYQQNFASSLGVQHVRRLA
jgi:hypothetical protein